MNMKKMTGLFGAVLSLFLFAEIGVWAGQEPAPAEQAKPADKAQAAPDTATAYYHYMLARRFQELARIHNRSDYLDRAIARV